MLEKINRPTLLAGGAVAALVIGLGAGMVARAPLDSALNGKPMAALAGADQPAVSADSAPPTTSELTARVRSTDYLPAEALAAAAPTDRRVSVDDPAPAVDPAPLEYGREDDAAGPPRDGPPDPPYPPAPPPPDTYDSPR